MGFLGRLSYKPIVVPFKAHLVVQVNIYADRARAARNPKLTYDLPNGTLYHGLNPPAGATPKGILYPRSGALGGCTNHNGGIMVYPSAEDWDQIARVTGDDSWQSDKMRKYFQKMENCQYLAKGTPGHGFRGWLSTNRADPSIWMTDNKMMNMFKVSDSPSSRAAHSMYCQKPNTHRL